MTDFKQIYATQAANYDALVSREDSQRNLWMALRQIRDFSGLGDALAEKIQQQQRAILPEYTGIWWRNCTDPKGLTSSNSMLCKAKPLGSLG